MSETQIYLVTPALPATPDFSDQLQIILDDFPIACVRLSTSSQDVAEIGRHADLLRGICHARDVPLVIDTHFLLVKPHGLDGVHLPDGARQIRDVRKELGPDAVIGAHCGVSRHNGISAAEAGADYVSFGPLSSQGLGDGSVAELELFKWWSDIVEIPVVAEAGLTVETVRLLGQVSDFIALGPEVWQSGQDYKTRVSEFFQAIE